MSEFDKPTGVPREASLFAGVFAGVSGEATPEATTAPADPTQEPAAPPLFTAYRPGAHTIGVGTSDEQLRIIVPSDAEPRTTLPGADYQLTLGALQRIVDLYRNDPGYSA